MADKITQKRLVSSLLPLTIPTLERKPCAGVLTVMLMSVYELAWSLSFGLSSLLNCHTLTWEAEVTM